MRKYFEIAKVLCKAQMAYRFDVYFNMLFIVIRILFAQILWGAVFAAREGVAGFTYQGMLSYYVVSSFLRGLQLSDGVSGEIAARIRGGSFSKFMVLPCGPLGHFMAQEAGVCAFYFAFNLAATVFWVLASGIRLALTAQAGLVAAAAALTLLGLVFMVQLDFFLGILAFRFQDVGLFLMIKSNLLAFVTGTMVPLALLPEAVQGVMRLFPFYYVNYLPAMLFLGREGPAALPALAVLTGWILLFIPINRLTYRRLRTRYEGVGA